MERGKKKNLNAAVSTESNLLFQLQVQWDAAGGHLTLPVIWRNLRKGRGGAGRRGGKASIDRGYEARQKEERQTVK